MEIFVHKNGARLGPFSLDQLRQEVQALKISFSDLVWLDGMEEWQPLRDLPDIVRTIPPPLPASNPNHLQGSPPPIPVTKSTPVKHESELKFEIWAWAVGGMFCFSAPFWFMSFLEWLVSASDPDPIWQFSDSRYSHPKTGWLLFIIPWSVGCKCFVKMFALIEERKKRQVKGTSTSTFPKQ